MYLDVHLMISEPSKYIDNFIDSNASLIVFHYEAVSKDEIDDLINYAIFILKTRLLYYNHHY